MIRSDRFITRLSAGLAGAAIVCLPALAQTSKTANSCKTECCAEASAKKPDATKAKEYRVVETQANVFTSSTQENTTFAVDSQTGNIVVAWDSRRQESGGYGVYARLLDPQGRPITPEIHVNEFIDGLQRMPTVSFDGQGGIWFAWGSSSQDGSGMGIVARRFSADFAEATDEIPVNVTRDGSQASPVIAANESGHVLMAWATPSDVLGTPDGATQFRMRLFDSSGEPITDELELPGDLSGAHDHGLTLHKLSSADEFIAMWTRASLDAGGAQILGQRVAADGSLIGKLIEISPNDGLFHVEPSVSSDASGRFVASWMTSGSEHGYSVSMRRFAADGTSIDDELQTVAPAAEIWKSGAAVAVAEDGRFAVAYNAFENGPNHDDIYVRLFDAEGRPMNEAPKRVNTSVEGRQYLTPATGVNRIAWTNDDSIVLAWNGKAAAGDSSGANVSILTKSDPDATASAPTVLETNFAAVEVTSDDYLTPIPPIWDPNWEPQEPLLNPQGDGPDFGFEAVQATGWTPPDPEMAVGLDSIVVMTNGEISAYDKDGTQLWQDEIENSFGFWGGQGATNFVFDPEVLWDPHTNRYFAMACERSNSGTSEFLLAVSKDSRPETNGDWWKWRINVTSLAGNDIDSPNMAVDDGHVYLTADFFGPDKYLIYVAEKAPLLSGGSLNWNHELITGTSQQSMGIPVMYDAAAPAQYIIQSTELSNNNSVILHAIRDPLNSYSRVTFTLPVQPYTYPNQPPQQGTSARPFLFEPRFWSCVQRNGSIWAVHHVNNSRVRARWYEIDMRGWPTSGQNPTVAQWGEIDLGGGIHTFFPSISVDNVGNAAITFARSATNEFISMSRAVRAFDDPAGSFQAAEFVKESNGYTTSGRWGDYSFTQSDPTADGVFWGHHEFLASNNNWRTWVAQYVVGGANDLLLTVDPLIAGLSATLTLEKGTPGLRGYFVYSLAGPGQTDVPQLNITLDIANPKLAGSRVFDNAGSASLSRKVPNGVKGRDVWMQGCENGATSNVVQDTVR